MRPELAGTFPRFMLVVACLISIWGVAAFGATTSAHAGLWDWASCIKDRVVFKTGEPVTVNWWGKANGVSDADVKYCTNKHGSPLP